MAGYHFYIQPECRGWTKDGIPTIEHLKEIGMDLPELVEVVQQHLN
jgi:aldehyde:ferredoxin oxidoreductase